MMTTTTPLHKISQRIVDPEDPHTTISTMTDKSTDTDSSRPSLIHP
jgi:hypothetical protein